MPVLPRRELGPLHQDLGAPGEKRPHGEDEHLIEIGRRALGRALARIGAVHARRRGVPPLDERLERVAVAREGDDLLVLGRVERVEAAQDVGRLPERQAEVGPVERNVGEADERPAGGLLRAQPLGIGLNPGQRHARLHAALHVDERDLHVDGRRQLGLRRLQFFQLDDFARFSALGRGGRSFTGRLC